MPLVELIVSVIFAVGGAIAERESNGRVTQIILYSDANLSECAK